MMAQKEMNPLAVSAFCESLAMMLQSGTARMKRRVCWRRIVVKDFHAAAWRYKSRAFGGYLRRHETKWLFPAVLLSNGGSRGKGRPHRKRAAQPEPVL